MCRDDIPSAARTKLDNQTVTPAHNTDLHRALCTNVDSNREVISVHTSGVTLQYLSMSMTNK
jgi:hypothetical protein